MNDHAAPLVSIIMPTYNYAGFIGESINSVITQTYRNWELIVIDNYSTDNTEEIVRGFACGQIRYIKFKNEGVIAASRNVGLKEASGEYVAFLDSDDLWLADKLEKQVSYLNANKDVFMVYSKAAAMENGVLTYTKGRAPGRRFGLANKGIFLDLYLSFNYISCLTVMFRNGSGFQFSEDRGLITVEDFDLWLAIAFEHEVGYIDEALAFYRVHGKNTGARLRKYVRASLNLIRKYRKQVSTPVQMRKYITFYAYILSIMPDAIGRMVRRS
ncbi:glycosyltransferase family 2 protein [Candidatus Magnetominusculus xianensis]|uniref:Glycosyltransferase-like protein, family 2 n=1 Tax=Candidatus Magnetominusculus xianensis TaxID=1748249 RepID=A0ABR5SEC2_9BACT|nr:glycosyltransferase family 2 protein [Candidatus Magnetominusculus xianensis]KWT82458.1 glycosyltransferase-like protein, family 2 [Candidatus Magnetominusculus xianensis]MBF0403178.1 glycosyltransferase family 2 protein [Nitrospirota bacterium]